jgi:hypothetical protein
VGGVAWLAADNAQWRGCPFYKARLVPEHGGERGFVSENEGADVFYEPPRVLQHKGNSRNAVNGQIAAGDVGW